MNVLYFASSRGNGLTYHLTQYAIGLKKADINITAIFEEEPYKEDLIKKLNENKVNNISKEGLDSINLFFFFKNCFWVAKLIDQYCFEIIQCQGVYHLVLVYISRIFSNQNPKILMYFHAFPFKYFQTPPKSRIVLPFLVKVINKLADGILPVSHQTANFLFKFGLDPKKTFVVYNSINFRKLNQYKNAEIQDKVQLSNILSNKRVIINIAQLETHKGQEILLKAAKDLLHKYDDLFFVIIGDGALKNDLINFSKELTINENVLFTGRLNYGLTMKLLSCAYAAVIPSYAETFCHALVEPMALGIPVVTTKVGISEDIIIDQKTGLFIPFGDSKSLSKKIMFLLENPALANQMGKSGQKEIEKNFDIEIITKRLVTVYKMVGD